MTSKTQTVHAIGRMHAYGGSTDVTAVAEPEGLRVQISRTGKLGKDRGRVTGSELISREAAALLVQVLGDIDDWNEFKDLTRLLREAAAYDATSGG